MTKKKIESIDKLTKNYLALIGITNLILSTIPQTPRLCLPTNRNGCIDLS